MIGMSAR